MHPSAGETVAIALVQAFSGLDACFDLPVGELERRPGYRDAWSVAQHLEHVGLANHFLLLTIEKGCRKALRRAAVLPVPETESDLALLTPIAIPGAFDWPPPAHMLPTGPRRLDALRDLLREQRDRCLQLLAGMPKGEGRLVGIRMSVYGLGRLDMYQWLYFLAQHARFHLAMVSQRRDA